MTGAEAWDAYGMVATIFGGAIMGYGVHTFARTEWPAIDDFLPEGSGFYLGIGLALAFVLM